MNHFGRAPKKILCRSGWLSGFLTWIIFCCFSLNGKLFLLLGYHILLHFILSYFCKSHTKINIQKAIHPLLFHSPDTTMATSESERSQKGKSSFYVGQRNAILLATTFAFQSPHEKEHETRNQRLERAQILGCASQIS